MQNRKKKVTKHALLTWQVAELDMLHVERITCSGDLLFRYKRFTGGQNTHQVLCMRRSRFIFAYAYHMYG